MQIGITHPLRRYLGWSPFPLWSVEADTFFCWDAHRVVIDGCDLLVVCNAANRFTGVTAMSGDKWTNLAAQCEGLIADAMRCAGYAEAAVEGYLHAAGEIVFGRTHGRRPVAYLNQMIETLRWCECEREERLQQLLMHIVNVEDFCHCATRSEYGIAAAWMAEDLLQHGIEPYDCERYPQKNTANLLSDEAGFPENIAAG